MPIGCPRYSGPRTDYIDDSIGDDKRFPLVTMQVDNLNSICSTFVICSPRHFTCAACRQGKTVDFSSIQSLLSPQEASSSTVDNPSTVTNSIALSTAKVNKVEKKESESAEDSTNMSSNESSLQESLSEVKVQEILLAAEPDSSAFSSSDSLDSVKEKAKKKIEPLSIKNESLRPLPAILPLIGFLLLAVVF
jgi:hypothetical protein